MVFKILWGYASCIPNVDYKQKYFLLITGIQKSQQMNLSMYLVSAVFFQEATLKTVGKYTPNDQMAYSNDLKPSLLWAVVVKPLM